MKFIRLAIMALVFPGVAYQSNADGGWHGGGGWRGGRGGGWYGGGGGWYGGGAVVITPGYYYPPYPYYYGNPYYQGYQPPPAYQGAASAGAGSIAVPVQEQLTRMGYYHGPIDGIVGPGTRAAISSYQQNHGLEVNGAIDPPLLRSLGLQ